MPGKTRHPSPQQRAHQRKLRATAGARAAERAPEPEEAPSQEVVASEPSLPAALVEPGVQVSPVQASLPTPRATGPRRARAARISPAGNLLLVKEVQRIAMLSVVLFAALVVLTISLR